MNPARPTNSGDARPLRPLALLAGLTLAGWMAGTLWPRALVMLGIYDYGRYFLDSYAVLASLDAVRAGADPHAANPLDHLMRHHVYSNWWLALRWLGLTREHNLYLGAAWVAAFAVTAWSTARPRTWGEAGWLAALMISPPFQLAVNRANNDLVIFVLLAGCGLAAVANGWVRPLVAATCLALATGLKYYPAPAALAFLWAGPVRRRPGVLLAALLAAGAALASVWTQVERSRFALGSGVHVMGAPLWWRDFGWTDAESVLPGVLLILAGTAVLLAGRVTMGLASRGEPPERLRAAVGAIIVLTCFLAGVNYAYRWIFLLWPALWWWRQAADAARPDRERWAARAGCALAAACVWLDGVVCLMVNLLPPRDPAWVAQVLVVYRQWTQPLHWLLMILLASWLLEGALTVAREWRSQPDPAG